MKRLSIIFLLVCFVGISMSGCLKRVSVKTVEKERVDQDLTTGNQGFISGEKPPDAQSKPRLNTRKIYQVAVEVPPYPEWKNFRSTPHEDKELWGNRGYVHGGPEAIEQLPEEMERNEPDSIILPEETREPEIPKPVVKSRPEPVEEKIEFKMYTVKKNDTLQKISLKMYGTTKKWNKIFNFNKDILRTPNKIYPGQKLKIPNE